MKKIRWEQIYLPLRMSILKEGRWDIFPTSVHRSNKFPLKYAFVINFEGVSTLGLGI